MLYKRLMWLKWWHPYNGALLYIRIIFHFLTFLTSKLPKRVPKKTKKYDIIFMLCTVSRFSPIYLLYPDYILLYPDYILLYPDYIMSYPDHILSYPIYIVLYPYYILLYLVISWLYCSDVDLRVHDLSVPCYPKPCMLRQNLHHLKKKKYFIQDLHET